ncbi:MAG: hypothetical protein KatS3mg110_3240 [Pirellulaceae bacterium]|nr:MAG: hypothetical protein KatS3mg110_3240 [Pirellulaceae bacterium]
MKENCHVVRRKALAMPVPKSEQKALASFAGFAISQSSLRNFNTSSCLSAASPAKHRKGRSLSYPFLQLIVPILSGCHDLRVVCYYRHPQLAKRSLNLGRFRCISGPRALFSRRRHKLLPLALSPQARGSVGVRGHMLRTNNT